MKSRYVYPFSAIVGQDKLKKALLINIVNPLVGGVLISGEKGTGKSTLVRGLGNLIHDMEVVELPLNVTEDRLVGAIDIEKAVLEGKKVVNNSILMKANGNILYVDEVNLLSESIINALLEVSQSGISRVEREGISFTHECSFVLVGTMNPEEGGLRPQLLDRFGLYVDVIGSEDLDERVKIIKRRIEYENDPLLFINEWKEKDKKIWDKIKSAREFISNVKVSEDIMKLASEISIKSNCSGHRAEIVMVEAAKAIAVLDGRKNITIGDLKEASELALPHRMRDNPPNVSEAPEEEPQDENENDEENKEQKQNNNEDLENNETPLEEQQEEESQDDNDDIEDDEDDIDNDNNEDSNDVNNSQSSDEETVDTIGDIFKVKDLDIKPLDRKKRKGSGRRSIVKTGELQGRYVRYTFPKGKPKDIAFDATLRAAAPYQRFRDKNGLALAIRDYDVREKVREKRTGSTILFVVDASGSMGVQKRMEAVKGAIMSLLTDAYQKRDSVGMIAFRREEAELILGVTRSVDLAHKKLEELPTGGKTPLTLGLYRGYEILKGAMKKDPDIIPVLVLVSDGRGNVSLEGGDPLEEALEVADKIAKEGIQSIVLDTEQDFIKLKLAEDIAKKMDAKYYKIEELRADEILTAVNGAR
ncbi:magnesium chelatase subunit D family protein [Anaerosalibacter sp. Marseille-P3206]|uniref:magnesium chelatase subunit D family protein n=1 Tax=Anaerosalibacter sp. Marseille-P3206 TaxID=1871005 RepID=UPI0009872227|nr:magnesium chelatase subunit D family protein [Anaerosalibacter sp. Marseille-P3206]